MPEITYPGVYVEEGGAAAKPIEGVPTSVAGFVGFTRRGPLNRPVTIASVDAFTRTFGDAAADTVLPQAVADFFANGGTQAVVVRSAALRAGRARPPGTVQLVGSPRRRSGLHALDRRVRINLLCIPDAVRPLPGPARPDPRVDAAKIYAAAAAFCAERHALLLIDPPVDATTPQAACAWRRLLPQRPASAFAAAYWPRLRGADDPAGSPGRAPSGAIAGVIARTDAARGPWRAPAGSDAAIRAAAGPAVTLDDEGSAALQDAAINPLRVLAGRGFVVWGARLLSSSESNDEIARYVPLRRLADFIEASIVEGLRWTSFEPNGPALWTRARGQVEAFLAGLFRAGAFQGRTARDAYFVRCDATTMTAADIAAGKLLIEIGFAPLKPAEFVILRLSQLAASGA